MCIHIRVRACVFVYVHMYAFVCLLTHVRVCEYVCGVQNLIVNFQQITIN